MRKNLLFAKISFLSLLVIIVFVYNANAQVLWGMSSAGGTKNGGGNIFSINTDGTGFAEKYSFSADGAGPRGQHLLNYGDGYLYGIVNGYYAGSGIIYRMLPDGSNYLVLYIFPTGSLYPFNQSQPLYSSLVKGPDGWLYGTIGGLYNQYGCIFKINKDGTGYQVLHSFSWTDGRYPVNELVMNGSDIYGTTYDGGSQGFGVVYTLKIDGTGYTVLHNFASAEGGYPNGPLAVLGTGNAAVLFGTTAQFGAHGYGTLYKLSVAANTFQVVHNFIDSTGVSYGTLLKDAKSGTILYGATKYGVYTGGMVYAFNTSSNVLTVIHSFSRDTNPLVEQQPDGILVDINDVLYGTTERGGSYHNGVLFKVNKNGSGYQVIHHQLDYNGFFGSLSVYNGQLYGLTEGGAGIEGGGKEQVITSDGTIYRLNPDGTGFQAIHSFICTNGHTPSGSLIYGSDGNLYGLTTNGGNMYSNGLAFSIKPDGTGFNPIVFLDNADGKGQPHGSLVQATNGSFYGMNNYSGQPGVGSIFKLSYVPPFGYGYTQYYPFVYNSGTGVFPKGSLLQASDGKLYGVTSANGDGSTYGTIFSINPDGSGFAVIHHFTSSDGSTATGSLIQAPDGFLYGMTSNGGAQGFGNIFKLRTDGSNYQSIFDLGSGNAALTAVNGTHPGGSLLLATDGKLYGMAYGGGAYLSGTVFRINTNGSAFQVIHHFNGSDGLFPDGSLIQEKATGFLYGTTEQGGTSNLGTLFKINTDGTVFQKLLDFNGKNGKYPKGDLLLLSASGNPLRKANTVSANTSNVADNSKETVEIAPNPVHNSFTIYYKTATQEKRCYIITDINGRIIKQNNPPSASQDLNQRVDISGVPAGIYIVKASIGNRQFIKKIVKQ